MKIVAGNSNRLLAQAIATYLEIDLAQCAVRRFADQEIFVEIQENVRGEDVFVVQSTSFPGQRQPDGAADHHRRAPPRLGPAHHRRDPLFRLCAAGPEVRRAHADLRQARRQPDHRGRRRPRADASTSMPARSRASSTSRPTTSIRAPVFTRDIKERYDDQQRRWWSRPMSAAWCAPAPSPSASTRRSPSSTSAASGRASRR